MSKTDILENLFVFYRWQKSWEIADGILKNVRVNQCKKSHHIYNKTVPSKRIMLVGSVQGIHWPDGEYITGPNLVRQIILQYYVFWTRPYYLFWRKGEKWKGHNNYFRGRNCSKCLHNTFYILTFHLVLWEGFPQLEPLYLLLFSATAEMFAETTSARTLQILQAHNS